MTIVLAPSAQEKAGFRNLRVVDKVSESNIITSFYLKSSDGSPLATFQPGQFLVLKIPLSEPKGHVLRNYSLSGSPDDLSQYRISVKREPSAGPGLPVGLSSNYLHDVINAGDVVIADGPRGAFLLDEKSNRPVVLLSAGVGLTPMVSMFHALARRSARKTLFLHACENGNVHALRDEVNSLIGHRKDLSAHYCYRVPNADDRTKHNYQSEGYINSDLIQRLLCLDDYDFYLCGPTPFMQAMYQLICGLGVDKNRISYEFFGPSMMLDQDVDPKPVPPIKVDTSNPSIGAIYVEFRKSGVVSKWSPSAQSLLSFAEEQGLNPEFSCRAGICGSCVSSIISGNVSYFEEPLTEPADGELLLCCSRPLTSIVLDL